MHATLCFHLPDQPALLRVIDPQSDEIVIGRGEDNAIVLPHASVSRRHASMRYDSQGWWVEDLGSTNGVRIGGHRVLRERLGHRDWFSLGDVFCEFQHARDDELAAYAARAERRRQTSGMWLGRLAEARDRDALLAGLIAAIVQLSECRRGFLLAGDLQSGLSTVACYGVTPVESAGRQFSGSNGAIIRAIHERKSILVNDPSTTDWASGRRSVVGRGLRALVALPILYRDRLLGVAYADSDAVGKLFTELDEEILGAFSQQASVLLAARGIDDSLARLESCIQADAAGNASGTVAVQRWGTLG
jgi:predicted DNA-binding ribbon-helix-helix protein